MKVATQELRASLCCRSNEFILSCQKQVGVFSSHWLSVFYITSSALAGPGSHCTFQKCPLYILLIPNIITGLPSQGEKCWHARGNQKTVLPLGSLGREIMVLESWNAFENRPCSPSTSCLGTPAVNVWFTSGCLTSYCFSYDWDSWIIHKQANEILHIMWHNAIWGDIACSLPHCKIMWRRPLKNPETTWLVLQAGLTIPQINVRLK